LYFGDNGEGDLLRPVSADIESQGAMEIAVHLALQNARISE
jgi:hypothetical protein